MEAPPRSRQPASWANIPVELAGLVLIRLPAHVDRVRFAAVCPQWRAAARQMPLPPPMPMLLLPDATVYSLPRSEAFHFPACMGYTNACGIGNWLVFSGEDGFFLRDPFTDETLTVPALSCARFQHLGDESSNDAEDEWFGMGERKLPVMHKTMFCLPHLIAAIFDYRSEQSTRIAVCQPGASSWWSVLVNAHMFVDIVFHQGKLYALDSKDALFSVDISVDHSTGDPCVSQIQQVITGLHVHNCHTIFLPDGGLILRANYLVESRGALLLVCREMDLWLKERNWDQIEVLEAERNRFEVYEANFGESQWAKVTTIGDDQVLFLRRMFSRSVNISQHMMPGDRIFFMDNDGHSNEASSTCRVYNMRDGKMSTPLPMVSWKPSGVFATWLLP